MEAFDFNKNINEANALFEMANLLPKRTGLKYTIWYGAKVPKHRPRIKVDLKDNNSVTICLDNYEVKGNVDKISQHDLNDIFRWLELNREVIIQYWEEAHTGTIDNGDVIDRIVKI